ncbi:hypothetical protein [Microvirga ossetica]|nr:hypothetical protein [Microvirga ossetica]
MRKILVIVILGLVPGIFVLPGKDVDGRDKPGHDAEKLLAGA